MLDDIPVLLTPTDVAEIFRVKERTVTNWARDGVMPFVRTPSGRYRFRRPDVLAKYFEIYPDQEVGN